MPFLRFSRDRRGYENTFLLHASRGRAGKGRPQLLYWFRTPPHVKVGRAAFDPEAIRVLEELHPDVRFDWARILETRPPPAPVEPARRGERRAVRPARPAAGFGTSAPSHAAEPVPVSTGFDPLTHLEPSPAEGVATPESTEAGESLNPPREPASEGRRFTRVFDREADEPAGEGDAEAPGPGLSAAERVLGSTKLELFRGRYAELLTRLDLRVGDQARRAVLREEAERLNPDAWVTEADVRAGADTFDAAITSLHRLLGRRRRRRRVRRSHADSRESAFPGAGPAEAEPTSGEGAGPPSGDRDEVDDGPE